MASIDKVATGWRARWRTPAGESRSETFKKKADAERRLAEVEGDKVRGLYVDPSAGRMLSPRLRGDLGGLKGPSAGYGNARRGRPTGPHSPPPRLPSSRPAPAHRSAGVREDVCRAPGARHSRERLPDTGRHVSRGGP